MIGVIDGEGRVKVRHKGLGDWHADCNGGFSRLCAAVVLVALPLGMAAERVKRKGKIVWGGSRTCLRDTLSFWHLL